MTAHPARADLPEPSAGPLMAVLVLSAIGLLQVAAVLQVFTPEWTDGDWIASSGIDGRAVGHRRQPNHLSSLLLRSAMA